MAINKLISGDTMASVQANTPAEAIKKTSTQPGASNPQPTRPFEVSDAHLPGGD